MSFEPDNKEHEVKELDVLKSILKELRIIRLILNEVTDLDINEAE